MSDLRDRVVKLAQENPELRKHLVPLLKEAGDTKQMGPMLWSILNKALASHKDTPWDYTYAATDKSYPVVINGVKAHTEDLQVPTQVTFKLDLRLTPKGEPQAFWEDLQEFLGSAEAKNPKLQQLPALRRNSLYSPSGSDSITALAFNPYWHDDEEVDIGGGHPETYTPTGNIRVDYTLSGSPVRPVVTALVTVDVRYDLEIPDQDLRDPNEGINRYDR